MVDLESLTKYIVYMITNTVFTISRYLKELCPAISTSIPSQPSKDTCLKTNRLIPLEANATSKTYYRLMMECKYLIMDMELLLWEINMRHSVTTNLKMMIKCL